MKALALAMDVALITTIMTVLNCAVYNGALSVPVCWFSADESSDSGNGCGFNNNNNDSCCCAEPHIENLTSVHKQD